MLLKQESHRICAGFIFLLISLGGFSAAQSPVPASRPESRPKPAVKTPPWCWDAEKSEKVESDLDAFFATSEIEQRKTLFKDRLSTADIGLSLEELDTIGLAKPPAGQTLWSGVSVWRVRCPWMKGHPRGAFNLVIPENYTPKKSWPLVLVLHGRRGHADRATGQGVQVLSQAGAFVILPSVTDVEHVWAQGVEVANVYRIFDYVARRWRIDFRRLSVMGGSMGGVGTWSTVLFRPDTFCAMAPIAGSGLALNQNSLATLRGIPIYILHGAADAKAPVIQARQSSAELQRLKIEHIYAEVPNMGHQAWPQESDKLLQWILQQGPKPFSARPLFLPPSGVRPLWERHQDPMGLTQQDEVLDHIRGGRLIEARKLITLRFRKSSGDARLYALRAHSRVPGLLKEFPLTFEPEDYPESDGWETTRETLAISDLKRALKSTRGKGPMALRFDIEVRLKLIQIYAKRTAMARRGKGQKWIMFYNLLTAQINAIPLIETGNSPVNALLAALEKKVPIKRKFAPQPP